MHHWQYLIMGSYLFTTYLTMLPSLPLLLPHPRLLSQFCCCSFTPHLPRFLPPLAITVPFPLGLLSFCCGWHAGDYDTLFISVHIPHIYLCLLPRHSFRVPMSILSALILIHDLCCFFSWAYLLIFCAFVCLFWWLFTCWRLECEFTLFKVLG